MEQQRQFRLRCKQVTNVERTSDWSNVYEITSRSGYNEILLSQPEEGSDKLKPLQCPICRAMLTVTIRSESDAKKRGIFLWTAFALSLLISVGFIIITIQTELIAYFIGFIVFFCLSGVFLYFGLPSQLRATLYDKDGTIAKSTTDGFGHELEEIRSAN